MARQILNQDRQLQFPYEPSRLVAVKTRWGAALMIYVPDYGDISLGDFETMAEACAEVDRLQKDPAELVTVNGYSNGGFAEW